MSKVVHLICIYFSLVWAIPGVAQLNPAKKDLRGNFFESPYQLKAGGKLIEAFLGKLSPTMHDHDGDGVDDLVVGFRPGGEVRFYKNIGNAEQPRFAAGEQLVIGKKNAGVPIC